MWLHREGICSDGYWTSRLRSRKTAAANAETLLLTFFSLVQETLEQWAIVFQICTAFYAVTGVVFFLFASADEQPWNRPKSSRANLVSTDSNLSAISNDPAAVNQSPNGMDNSGYADEKRVKDGEKSSSFYWWLSFFCLFIFRLIYSVLFFKLFLIIWWECTPILYAIFLRFFPYPSSNTTFPWLN